MRILKCLWVFCIIFIMESYGLYSSQNCLAPKSRVNQTLMTPKQFIQFLRTKNRLFDAIQKQNLPEETSPNEQIILNQFNPIQDLIQGANKGALLGSVILGGFSFDLLGVLTGFFAGSLIGSYVYLLIQFFKIDAIRMTDIKYQLKEMYQTVLAGFASGFLIGLVANALIYSLGWIRNEGLNWTLLMLNFSYGTALLSYRLVVKNRQILKLKIAYRQALLGQSMNIRSDAWQRVKKMLMEVDYPIDMLTLVFCYELKLWLKKMQNQIPDQWEQSQEKLKMAIRKIDQFMILLNQEYLKEGHLIFTIGFNDRNISGNLDLVLFQNELAEWIFNAKDHDFEIPKIDPIEDEEDDPISDAYIAGLWINLLPLLSQRSRTENDQIQEAWVEYSFDSKKEIFEKLLISQQWIDFLNLWILTIFSDKIIFPEKRRLYQWFLSSNSKLKQIPKPYSQILQILLQYLPDTLLGQHKGRILLLAA